MLSPRPTFIRLTLACVVTALWSVSLLSTRERHPMTWDQRIAAQRAIERVYHAHQIGSTRSFQEAVPEALLELKVRTYLQQSLALERHWKTPVTREALRREMARMEESSQLPDRLRQLYAALGNDPFVIQETLVRPVLVDRLARSFFATDERIHATARSRAEALRGRLLDRSRRARVREAAAEVEMSREEVDRRWRGARRAAGAVGPVIEEPRSFVVERVLSERRGSLRLARYAVAKPTWDQWWGVASAELDPRQVHPVADPSVSTAPSPALVPMGSTLSGEQASEPCLPGDVWDNASLDDMPSPRSGHTALWTGSVMIIWGGTSDSLGSRYDPLTDSWSSLSTIDAPSPRSDHTAVWTGTEMIVWGGGTFPNYLATGGRYNPINDTWTAISTEDAPPARTDHTAVWTGTRMLVWGGEGSGSAGRGDGGRYDPASDSWEPISQEDSPEGRTRHTAIWTGSEMIVWGGFIAASPTTFFVAGGRYDPASDSWQTTSTMDAPSGRIGHTAVWAGSEMIVWGGGAGGGDGHFATGGRYSPATDSWSATALDGAPDPRGGHSAVWTGSEMILWGGVNIPCCDFSEPRDTGARYDPATDTWAPTSPTNAPSARDSHTALWTGDRMLLWGGQLTVVTVGGVNQFLHKTGARYDPSSDTWTPTSVGSGPPGSGQAAVWTGNVMVDWGGRDLPTGASSGVGGRYDPALDAWSPTSTANAPSARSGHTGVWTGDELIVWGGSGPSGRLGTGARYDPVADVWLALPTLDAPSPRTLHTAVWAGGSMIVWGGSTSSASSGRTNTGAIYDAASDAWMPTSTTDAPQGRERHTAVWTGSRMIVWGGFLFTTPPVSPLTQTGGIFDPAANAWSPTPIAGAPTPRNSHTAVWTGSEMIVWGGNSTGIPSFSRSGGRYDPSSDSWAATEPTGAPAARVGHTAVWTGTEMIVWDGTAFGTGGMPTGGRYDAAADAWIPMSAAGAPSRRAGHAAVWTGTHMIVYGGTAGRNGGRYRLVEPQDDDGDGFTPCDGDCDDSDPDAHPGGLDLPGDLSDQDCSGTRLCDPEGVWRSHGAFVNCVSKKCELYMAAGLLTQEDCDALIRDAAHSSVGR